MPVTIKKPASKTAKPAPKVSLAQKPAAKKALAKVEVTDPTTLDALSDQELADRYGAAQDRVEALKHDPAYAELAQLSEALATRLKQYDKEEEVTIKGKAWVVQASAGRNGIRKVTKPLTVLKYLGSETFAKIASIGVADAEKYLTPEQLASVITDPGRTDSRTIKALYIGG